MNAALSKDQELVEFVWDFSCTYEVAMHYFDYSSKSMKAYRVNVEPPEFARAMWKSLIESGWEQVPHKYRKPTPA